MMIRTHRCPEGRLLAKVSATHVVTSTKIESHVSKGSGMSGSCCSSSLKPHPNRSLSLSSYIHHILFAQSGFGVCSQIAFYISKVISVSGASCCFCIL